MDATELTTKNRKMAETYTNAVAHLVDGVLLSGSNAWGANYSVTPNSDIDLLITADIEHLRGAIEFLISKELLNTEERERFQLFYKLYNEKKAEQFSTIATHLDTKVSLDFLPLEEAKKICELSPMAVRKIEGIDVRVIKEFRLNPPKSTGYSLDDLTGQRKLIYHPHFEDVEKGYIAETAVDAKTESNYFLGVMSFFFAIHPVILFDKEGELKMLTKTLQSNIAYIIGNKTPTYITRQERMQNSTLESIKKSLSQS